MIKVAVAGYAGRMGSAVVDAVTAADDMVVACGIDPALKDAAFPVFSNINDAIDSVEFDVLVDFTQPDVVAGNVEKALAAGRNCVVGTTGLSNEVLEGLAEKAVDDACLFVAPNFTTGAVLMMQFAKAAAPYFPEAEVLEFHHARKKDAPSGTAVRTAQMIAEARGFESSAPGKETEMLICVVQKHQVVAMEKIIAAHPGAFAYSTVINETLGNYEKIRYNVFEHLKKK